MADHADHLVPLGFGRRDAQQQPLADRRFAAERQRREGLVDDDLPRQVGLLIDVVVGVGEEASLDQPRAQRLEVAGQDDVEVRLPELAGIGHGGLGAPAAVDQLPSSGSGVAAVTPVTPGNREQPLAHLLHEHRALPGLPRSRLQHERQDVVRIVARD